MVPHDSVGGSDLSTNIPLIKSRLKDVLLETQKIYPPHLLG